MRIRQGITCQIFYSLELGMYLLTAAKLRINVKDSMKHQIHRLLLLLFAVVICSCSKLEDNKNTITLKTGISVLDTETAKCSDAESQDELLLSQKANNYILSINQIFTCNSNLESPWLSVTKEHRATLVLDENRWSMTGCECRKKVRIQIAGRLEKGDTLYVLRDSEVIGHFLLP